MTSLGATMIPCALAATSFSKSSLKTTRHSSAAERMSSFDFEYAVAVRRARSSFSCRVLRSRATADLRIGAAMVTLLPRASDSSCAISVFRTQLSGRMI